MTTVCFFDEPAVSYLDELKKNLISLLVRFYLLHCLRYIGTLNILITKSEQILTRFIQALFNSLYSEIVFCICLICIEIQSLNMRDYMPKFMILKMELLFPHSIMLMLAELRQPLGFQYVPISGVPLPPSLCSLVCLPCGCL